MTATSVRRMPLSRAVVDLRAVVNIKDMDSAAGLINPVDDAVSAAPGAVATSEWPEERLPYSLRVDCKRGIAELQHGGRNRLRKPFGNRSPCGRLEPDLVSPRRVG